MVSESTIVVKPNVSFVNVIPKLSDIMDFGNKADQGPKLTQCASKSPRLTQCALSPSQWTGEKLRVF
jgi:hypothetical protein